MTITPTVSVVIPVFNTGPYLAECLDSVVAQTMRDIEVICVDNGSTDGSRDVLAEYARRDDRVRVIDEPQRGLPRARNRGLDEASGEYIMFLDSDDFFEPTMLAEVHARCEADGSDVGVFRIRYRYQDKGTALEADWSLRTELVPGEVFAPSEITGSIYRFVTPCVWNKLFRHSFLAETGIRFTPDLKRAEDIPFTYLALARAKRISVVDKALVNYRTGLSGSLQATIHEEPFEICRALDLLRSGLVEAGVFDQFERDFVNTALYQCLYTVETIKTSEAYVAIYEGLRTKWLAELGIDGHDRDYFYDSRQFELLERLQRESAQDFMFGAVRGLLREAEVVRDQLARTRDALTNEKRALKKLKKSRAYRIGLRLRPLEPVLDLLLPADRKAEL